MSYLLDTNVLSETIRPRPDQRVLRWLESVPNEALFISVLTVGEIRRGVERMSDGRRREKMRAWLEHEVLNWFGERVLDIGLPVANRWGHLLGQMPRPMPAIDSLLAATALHHDLRLVTRNTKDFHVPGLEVIDPWNARGN